MLKLIHSQGHSVVPWRNGGGVTREVALHSDPDGGFFWRVSIATVSQSGPFSRFDAIDRTIAVLAGAGFGLRVDGRHVTLSPAEPLFAFAGEAEVVSEVSSGETTDLNVITRRSVFSHYVRRLRISDQTQLALPPGLNLLVFNDRCRVQLAGADLNVGKLDTVLIDEKRPALKLEPQPSCELFVIAIRRCSESHS